MVLVQHILETARKRLAVLSQDASLCDAAEILANPETPLVVVCDREGSAVGVISRGDLVRVLATASEAALDLQADAIMTKAMLSCHVDEALQGVWTTLSSRSLRCAPVLDHDGRPQGIVHARDIAKALLNEVNEEELLLRDYVLGIGYQ
jgi:CBS domain-containing protein